MFSIEIRLIIFFAAKDGGALYSQQKQDQDLTEIMNSLLLNWNYSVVSDSATPWTVANQASPSMGFSRQEYWSGLNFLLHTSSNRKIWPWSTEWSRAKANRVLPRECTCHSKHSFPTTQEKTPHGRHQMVNIKIRLIIFFAAKDGEAKQDQELTVAQIMNSLLPNSDLNWRKWGKPLDHSCMT